MGFLDEPTVLPHRYPQVGTSVADLDTDPAGSGPFLPDSVIHNYSYVKQVSPFLSIPWQKLLVFCK